MCKHIHNNKKKDDLSIAKYFLFSKEKSYSTILINLYENI